MLLTRRHAIALAASALAVAALPLPARAHHGWRWTADGEFELTGIVTETRLGNPHGLLTIDADGEEWIAEVGQPWRNERAGLTDEMFAPGTEITLRGHRDADPSERRMKAERVILSGTMYDLYPDRS